MSSVTNYIVNWLLTRRGRRSAAYTVLLSIAGVSVWLPTFGVIVQLMALLVGARLWHDWFRTRFEVGRGMRYLSRPTRRRLACIGCRVYAWLALIAANSIVLLIASSQHDNFSTGYTSWSTPRIAVGLNLLFMVLALLDFGAAREVTRSAGYAAYRDYNPTRAELVAKLQQILLISDDWNVSTSPLALTALVPVLFAMLVTIAVAVSPHTPSAFSIKNTSSNLISDGADGSHDSKAHASESTKHTSSADNEKPSSQTTSPVTSTTAASTPVATGQDTEPSTPLATGPATSTAATAPENTTTVPASTTSVPTSTTSTTTAPTTPTPSTTPSTTTTTSF